MLHNTNKTHKPNEMPGRIILNLPCLHCLNCCKCATNIVITNQLGKSMILILRRWVSEWEWLTDTDRHTHCPRAEQVNCPLCWFPSRPPRMTLFRPSTVLFIYLGVCINLQLKEVLDRCHIAQVCFLHVDCSQPPHWSPPTQSCTGIARIPHAHFTSFTWTLHRTAFTPESVRVSTLSW